MMREIALTPQSLDPSEHPDSEEWTEWARELLHRMVPEEGVSRFLIADLYDGSWQSRLPDVQKIKGLPQRIRWRLQALFTAVREYSVSRPARLPDWPQSEDDWLAEAMESSKQLKLTRIISTSRASAPTDAPTGLIRSDDTYHEPGFWDELCSTGPVALRLADQLELLRPVATHAQWIALINPHALASESEFTRKFARMIAMRPADFTPFKSLDIHVNADESDPASESSKDYWRKQLSNSGHATGMIRVYFWPGGTLLDRNLLAGEIESLGSPSQRWGVHFGHLARRDDNVDAAPTEWKLLSKASRVDWRRRLYDLPGSDPVATWIFQASTP